MSDHQPSWMPGGEKINAAWREAEDEGCDPIRSLIRAAVEKALAEQEQTHSGAFEDLMARFRGLLAEQEARHRHQISAVAAAATATYEQQAARHKREVLEARIEEVSIFCHYHDCGPGESGFECATCRRLMSLRAELAAPYNPKNAIDAATPDDAGEEAKHG